MEKPKAKCLKNIDLLPETLIYFIDLNIDLNIELNIDLLPQAFNEWAMSYKVESVEKNIH